MQYLHLSDEELAGQIIAEGQLEAFGELFDRYHLIIYNKCLVFVTSHDKAEELTHDIFMKAFINLKEIDHISDFRLWFYGITYQMCLKHADVNLKQNTNAYWEIDEVEEIRVKVFHCNSEEQLLSLDVNKLRQVLQKMHSKDRMILLMKYQDGMDSELIAKQLDLSEHEIETRLNLALERAVAIHQILINNQKTNEQPKVIKSI